MNDNIYGQPPEAAGAESEIEGTIFKVNTKYLDEKSAKNEELEKRLHKRNLSRFKFSIFIPVSPPVRVFLLLGPLKLFKKYKKFKKLQS